MEREAVRWGCKREEEALVGVGDSIMTERAGSEV
jgi:hypothetical protein